MNMMGKPASFIKRMCSIFIDLVFVAILYIVFATISLQISNNYLGRGSLYNEINTVLEERYQMAIDEGFLYYDENDDQYKFKEGFDENSKVVQDFYNSNEYKELESRYSELSIKINRIDTIRFAIDIHFAEIATFLIIPLCRKDGASLGKIVMKLSVVSRNDCRVNIFQKIFRFLIIYVLESVFCYYFFNYLALIFLPVIELAFWCFSSHKLFIHDLLCSTKVVENASSVIFENVEEMENYFIQKDMEDKEYAEKREKMRNKHVDMEGFND